MAPVQTTYTERQRVAVAGMLYGTDHNIDTGIVETAAGIGFGLAVSQGANDKGIVLGGTLAGFRGLTVRDITLGAEDDIYKQYINAGVLVRGYMWAVPGADVAPGDPVHFDAATGALSNTGGQGPIPRARWASTAAAGDVALVELK